MCAPLMFFVVRRRPLLQGVSSSKTVHWTVFEFTSCGALLRQKQGFAPTRGAASGLRQKENPPFGTPLLLTSVILSFSPIFR